MYLTSSRFKMLLLGPNLQDILASSIQPKLKTLLKVLRARRYRFSTLHYVIQLKSQISPSLIIPLSMLNVSPFLSVSNCLLSAHYRIPTVQKRSAHINVAFFLANFERRIRTHIRYKENFCSTRTAKIGRPHCTGKDTAYDFLPVG